MFPVWITVLYLVLGFVFGLWHPGWLVFLTVPIHYMHFDSQWERLTNPVTVTLIYLVLGFFFGLWHPGWLVFLAIPLGEMYKSCSMDVLAQEGRDSPSLRRYPRS